MAFSLGELVVGIAGDIAKLVESMNRAEYVTSQTSKKIENAMRSAEEAIKGLGAAFISFKTVEAFADNIDGAIEYAASLHEVAIRAGTTASELSSMTTLAKQSGTTIETVAKSMGTLAKSALETAQGTGKAREVFETLKISVLDNNKQLKPTGELLREVAQKLSSMNNETLAVAAAQKLMRGTGQELLPFMRDLAEASDLQAKITNRQAYEADRYKDALETLRAQQQQWYINIATQVTPVLEAAVNVMISMNKEADSLKSRTAQLAQQNTIREWAINAGVGVAMLIDGLRYVKFGVVTVGEAIAPLAVMAVEQFRLMSEGVRLLGEGMKETAKIALGLALAMNPATAAQGFQIASEGWAGLVKVTDEAKVELKKSLGEIGIAWEGFQESLADRASKFEQGSTVTAFLNSVQNVLSEVPKLGTAGKEATDIVKKFKSDGIDSLNEALLKSVAALQANYDSLRKYGVEVKSTALVETQIQLKHLEATGALAEHAKRTGESTEAVRERVLALARMKDELTEAVRLEKEYVSALNAHNKEMSDSVQNAVDQVERQRDLNATIGMTAEQLTRYNIVKLEAKRADAALMDGSENVVKMYDLLIQKFKELAGLQGQGAGARELVSAMGELSDRIAGAVTHMRTWSDLITYAKSQVMDLVAELLKLAAKKFVLNIVGNLVGGEAGQGILNAALQAGGGSLAGTLLSSGGSFLSRLFGGGSSAGFGMAEGYAFGGAAGGAGGAGILGALGSAMPWIGVALTAIAGLRALFGDKGENWKAMLGFGSNANVYRREGVFGAEGFDHIAGSDAVNRQLATFMASTDVIDKVIAATLTSAQIATITANLAAPYLTRTDGQPAEMAFGKDDANAAQAITLEYLQKKYGTVFDTIDKTFADFIRGYTGKSEDLLKEIQSFVQVMTGISAMGLKGLNLESLRAMAQDGETLSQTFERVGEQWAYFTDNFTTDAEKLATLNDLVVSTFRDLGLEVPKTREAFAELVKGLDLSTEEGRKMFQMLMNIAPAFASIEAASASAVARFNSLASQLSPSFGAANSRSVLEATVREWMNLAPGNGALNGWTVDSTIANIGNLINSGNIGQALTFAQALGGGAVDVLNRMLAAYQAWQQAMAGAGGGGNGLQGQPNPTMEALDASVRAANAARLLAEQLENARRSLAGFVDSLFLNPELSPLNPAARLAEAKAQYDRLLGLAQAGDLSGMTGVQDAATTYLTLLRQLEKSGTEYTQGWRSVVDELATVAQVDVNERFARALPAGNDTLMTDQTGQQIVMSVQDLAAILMSGQAQVQAPAVAAAQQQTTRAVENASNVGLLAG